jgi:hypothetical protein
MPIVPLPPTAQPSQNHCVSSAATEGAKNEPLSNLAGEC